MSNRETLVSAGSFRDPDRVWRGLDAEVAKKYILPHGVTSFIDVNFKEGCFPDNLTADEAGRIQASGRSRLVQIGAAPKRHFTAEKIALACLDEQKKGRNSFKVKEVALENLSLRDVELEKGDRLFSPYIVPKNPIKNGELIELMRNHSIQIDGKEGDGDEGTPEYGDWVLYHEEDLESNEDVAGIALRVQRTRFFIPPNPKALHVPSDIADYRSFVRGHWVDTKFQTQRLAPTLWFGTTVPTNFVYPYVAEIDPEAYPHFKKNRPHGHPWIHHESRFLGSEDPWEIVGEFYAPLEGPEKVDWMVLKFYRQ